MRTIKFEKMLTDLKKTIDRKEIDLLPPYVFSGEVKVIEEARQVGEAADFLSRHACLGFDTETRPAFRKGEIYKVSLLQLAVPDQVFLFRLNKCGFQPALVRQLSVLLAVPVVFRVQPAWLSASVALPLAFRLQEYQPFFLPPVLSEQSQPSAFQRLIGFLLP